MSELENAIEEQKRIVAAHKSAREKKMIRNTKDIRDEIAKGGHYEPKDDPIYEYQPYPKWVTVGDESHIVQSKQEHDALLGIKTEPAKAATVDIASLAQPDAPRAKRKYTKRAEAAPLPATIE